MEFIKMIGISKKGELLQIESNSSITEHQFIGGIFTNPSQLNGDYQNIANHFYCTDPEQLQMLTLNALRINQSRRHLLSEQP